MPTADAATIRAVVASLSRGADHPSDERVADRRSVLAIRADPTWNGPERLDDGIPPIRVVAASSPLAAREAVVHHEETAKVSGELLVLLMNCASSDLGLDLRVLLVKGEVQSFDPFRSVLALFKAQVLDPALASERWLIDDLISLAPVSGWMQSPPLSGALTVELAWATWQGARIGIDEIPSTLGDVLRIVDDPGIVRALGSLTDEARQHLGDL